MYYPSSLTSWVICEAIKRARQKDPLFLASSLFDRLLDLSCETAYLMAHNIMQSEESVSEFKKVARLICGFADISNQLSWTDFEKENNLGR